MPWDATSATRFTKKATSPKAKRQWSKVADSILKRTGDEARAVRGANSVIKRGTLKRKSSRG